jgi:hypothetical protein
VTDEVAGKGADPTPGTGRLLAGYVESPELASKLVCYLLQSIIPDAQLFPQPQLELHSEHCLTYDDH